MKLKGALAKQQKELRRGARSPHFSAGHHKLPRVWVIIADKENAKIFSKAGGSIEKIGEAIAEQLSEEEKGPIGKKSKTEKEDAEQKERQKQDTTPSIEFSPSMSPTRRKAFKFAHEIAIWLDNSLGKQAFDRLILVAPPQTLSDIRTALSKPVKSRLIAEVNKNLADLSEENIKEGLNKLNWF